MFAPYFGSCSRGSLWLATCFSLSTFVKLSTPPIPPSVSLNSPKQSPDHKVTCHKCSMGTQKGNSVEEFNWSWIAGNGLAWFCEVTSTLFLSSTFCLLAVTGDLFCLSPPPLSVEKLLQVLPAPLSGLRSSK